MCCCGYLVQETIVLLQGVPSVTMLHGNGMESGSELHGDAMGGSSTGGLRTLPFPYTEMKPHARDLASRP